MAEVFTIKNDITQFKSKVDLNSQQIDELTTHIISKYTKELDELVAEVKKCLENVNDITDFEYETLALKIPCFLYWTTGGTEAVGVRSDISKAFEKEKYNKIYDTLSGTAKERDSVATMETRAENVVTIAYNRAYKVLQQKVNCAFELLAVIKKILSRRIQQQIPSI